MVNRPAKEQLKPGTDLGGEGMDWVVSHPPTPLWWGHKWE